MGLKPWAKSHFPSRDELRLPHVDARARLRDCRIESFRQGIHTLTRDAVNQFFERRKFYTTKITKIAKIRENTVLVFQDPTPSTE
jgi:hypothetical protein